MIFNPGILSITRNRSWDVRKTECLSYKERIEYYEPVLTEADN